jgi:hypothetical protein
MDAPSRCARPVYDPPPSLGQLQRLLATFAFSKRWPMSPHSRSNHMASQRDPENRSLEREIHRSERIDRSGRLIFPVIAALIIIATVGYLYGASHVEINPGRVILRSS